MTAPRWQEVYAQRLGGEWPVSHPVRTPFVRDPSCGAHCSGKHEREAALGCPLCDLRLYDLVRHEWAHQEGHYFYATAPREGVPLGLRACPQCGAALQRMHP